MCNCDCRSIQKKVTNKVLKEYDEYLKKREIFDKYHGIFQPIRAAVRVYNNDSNLDINELLCSTEEFTTLKKFYTEDTATNMTDQEVSARTTTVGYFSAWNKLNEGRLSIGCSFCRPKDYPVFQKYRGKLLAMNCRNGFADIDAAFCQIFGDVTDMIKVFDPFSERFFNMPILENVEDKLFMYDVTSNQLVIYFFPKDLSIQAKQFFDRCCRYYGHRHFADMIKTRVEAHNFLYQFPSMHVHL